MSTVLVLTNSRDGRNSSVVIDEINRRGHKIIRFDSDFITRGEHLLQIKYSNDQRSIHLITPEQTFDLATVDSVWFRRPYFFDFKVSDPVQKNVAEGEVRDVLQGLWELLRDKYWISSPSAISLARLKPYQLALAQVHDLRIVESLITNEPKAAKAFCENGKTVFKPFKGYNFEYDDHNLSVFTTLLTPKHIANLDLVRTQPVLFQRWIEKAYEVRVTCVGRKLHAVKLSCDNYNEVIDWRDPNVLSKLQYEVIELPKQVSRSIISLITELDLNFAALDFAVNKNGDYIFLEINPIGQWLWLEDATSIPVSKEIADLLIKEGGDKSG